MAVTIKSPKALRPSPGGYISQGTQLTGKFLFQGATTIDGEVNGELQVHGHLIIGEHATIEGKIIANSVLTLGRISGDILADKKVEIQPPGVVFGDITTPNLVIGDGAIFEGNSYMKREHKEGKVLPLLRPTATPGSTEEPNSDL